MRLQRLARFPLVMAVPLVFLALACSEKAAPRVPLSLPPTVAADAASLTARGIHDYQNGRFAEAKSAFEQVLGTAPGVGEAHYNLGLALFALGEVDEARQHFIEAANLAPGNKVIWDSPALRPYGAPEPSIKQTKEQTPPAGRPGFGGGMMR